MKKFKTIDLFAGIGGIRLGFESEGFETLYSNDFDSKCKLTYDSNFSSAQLDVDDVWNVINKDLPSFDLLLGGFPCQAFSIAGYRHGFNDSKGRGNLFFAIAQILEKYKPQAFLLENVKNLYGHDNGRTFKIIEDTLVNQLGYHVKSNILNSMEYGNVPQNRERIYIVGFKDKNKSDKFQWPSKITLKKSVSDLLDLKVDERYYYNNKPLYEKIKVHQIEKNKVYQWRRIYLRENKKGVCPTLTANMGMGGHNVPIILDDNGVRKLTPRECARIQGFPDNYILPTIADSVLYKQLGNSVTVPVLKRIAQEIYKVLI